MPEYFLQWLQKQNLKPKELVKLLRLSLEIGVDAVMQRECHNVLAQSGEIQDKVLVAAVDLSAYDALCSARTEVST